MTQLEARIALGRKVAASYGRLEGVAASFIFGSVGDGLADRHSDLEIGVLWENSPDERCLKEHARVLGAEDWVFEGFHDKKLSFGECFYRSFEGACYGFV